VLDSWRHLKSAMSLLWREQLTAEVNKSYTSRTMKIMRMVRDPALQPALKLKPTARLRLLLAPLQKPLRSLRPKRLRLDLCAIHGIKNTAIVCDVAYYVAYDVTTYDVQSRAYDISYDDDHTTS
jgi:hypothetical protein